MGGGIDGTSARLARKSRAEAASAGGLWLAGGDGRAEMSRMLSWRLHGLVQRFDRLRRELHGGDIDLASIVEAVGLATAAYSMQAAAPLPARGTHAKAMASGAPRKPMVRGVSAHAVALATCIPRETARRKIKKLVERGLLTQVRRGEYMLTPAVLHGAATPEGLDEAVADALRFLNECLKSGLFRWHPDGARDLLAYLGYAPP